jgi:AraC family cel operon transcriptional repressor
MTSAKIPRLRLGKIVAPGDYGIISRPRHSRRRPLQPHRHDFAEIFWVNEGEGVHEVNGRRARLRPGDLCCIHQDDTHSIDVPGDATLVITNVAFPAEVVDWLRRRYFPGESRWFWADDRTRSGHADAPRLHALNTAADRLAAAPRDRLHFEFFLLGVFAELDGPHGEEALSGAPDWLAEACRRLREPAALAEGVAALFRLAGRSPEHVARVTRATLGMTPSEYVNRLRIEQAAFQLRMTSRPVTEIALDAGYQNLSHFFHVFRRLQGMSPRRYRERLAAR